MNGDLELQRVSFMRAYETVSLGCQEKDLGVAVGTHSHLIADGSWDAASVSYLHKVVMST